MFQKIESFCSLKSSEKNSGSLKELWIISFPLMLSLMSSSLMFFADRLFLAQYSIDAHNAATSAGNIVAFLQFIFICTTCIAEVFVGQYNGAGEKSKIGRPVWQMIWLSLFSSLIFFPIGFYGGEFIFSGSRYEAMEIEYFRYLMLCGPIFCLSGAISAFYIGRGSLAFATSITIGANILNAILAYFLILGCEPYFGPQGIKGAAYATGISQGIQSFIMFLDFMRKENRQTFGTGKWHFVWTEFYKCLSFGVPSSLAHTIEILAWALFFRMLMNVSDDHITVASVAQTILFLFTFMTEGISKGAMALASNMVGAKKWNTIWKLLFSGVKFYCIVFVILGFFLVVEPSYIIQLFVPSNEQNSKLYVLIASSCLWVWLFFLFDGIHWLVVGLLTATGDSKFVLKTGSTTIWFFALLPTYVLVVHFGVSPDLAWAITAFYALTISSIYLLRFYSERWKEKLLDAHCVAAA